MWIQSLRTSIPRTLSTQISTTSLPRLTTMSTQQIDLHKGWPHASLLPSVELGNAASSILSDPKHALDALQYNDFPGAVNLRESLAHLLSSFYQPRAPIDASRVFVTGGASIGLLNVLLRFTDPQWTQNVFMISPTYFLACRIFEDAGFTGKMSSVPEDEEGIDLEVLERKLAQSPKSSVLPLKSPPQYPKVYRHVIYGVPTFSNPSSTIMTLRRREGLIRLARKYDALVITDDVYDFLQWRCNGEVLEGGAHHRACQPRIVDVDRYLDGGAEREGSHQFGNTVSNGSFTKILGPGCRTGWIEATPNIVEVLASSGTNISGGPGSQLLAWIIGHMIDSGELENHIYSTLQPQYAKRYILLRRAIEEYLTPLGVQIPNDGPVQGGYFIWISLPARLDADVVCKAAEEEEKLIMAPESIFHVWGEESGESRSNHHLRLSFSFMEDVALVEGIKRLGRVLERLLKNT